MLSKEEIEKAKEDLRFCNEGDYITKEMSDRKNVLLEYIEQLEIKTKELGRCQQSLMQSRRKWKNRYYKVRKKNKKLESDKQKLIEKLEETIDFTKTSKDLTSKAKIEVLENVLKILKGEK